MAILYKKTRRYQEGGGTGDTDQQWQPKFIYTSAEEAAENPMLKSIRTKTDNGTSRCLGSALDAAAVCGYDYRPTISGQRQRIEAEGGEWLAPKRDNDDKVVDSWDMYDVFKGSDDVRFLYDRHSGQEWSNDYLKDLPVNTLIGIGDARNDRYMSKDYKDRRSIHTIAIIGYASDGTPIVYDTGKVYEGIPQKYLNRINYIMTHKDAQDYNTIAQLSGTGTTQQGTGEGEEENTLNAFQENYQVSNPDNVSLQNWFTTLSNIMGDEEAWVSWGKQDQEQ